MIINRDLELFNFFSSYLNDMIYLIHSLKNIVYKIINIQDIFKPIVPTYPDLNSIIFSCNKSHDDLRQIQSMLKGYSQVKQYSNESSKFNNNFNLIRQSRNIKNRNQLKLQNSIIQQQESKTQSTDYNQKNSLSAKQKVNEKPIFLLKSLQKDDFKFQQTSQTTFNEHKANKLLKMEPNVNKIIKRRISINMNKINNQLHNESKTQDIEWANKQLIKSKSTGVLHSLQYVKLIRNQLKILQ